MVLKAISKVWYSGVLSYISYIGMGRPKGYCCRAASVWLCPFCSGFEYCFSRKTTGLHERIGRFHFRWFRKKEKYPNSKWILRNIFVGVLINLRAEVSLSHGSWRLRSRLICVACQSHTWFVLYVSGETTRLTTQEQKYMEEGQTRGRGAERAFFPLLLLPFPYFDASTSLGIIFWLTRLGQFERPNRSHCKILCRPLKA